MKRLLIFVAAATMAFTSFNCSDEPVDYIEQELQFLEDNISLEANDVCVGSNPEARISNNGNVAMNLDIIDEDDNVVGYVHNLLPGNTSGWISFPPGEILFSVSNDVVEDEKVVYTMSTCMIFDLEVDIDNKLTSAEPESI
ncbi:MAG: hypothetical protein HKN00_14310 [Flavobacteriaceae bacterium]|nr:hypothetical protein [Bacteroidia bacterium]MBT8268695.1 hypothetical protein [Bacteroidia bacterium]NNF76355.1 hypothetical protein [Flavobacteriaceae bacterium]NNL80924.1 hypothetical protein [Flavobacteriaceae bacterium]